MLLQETDFKQEDRLKIKEQEKVFHVNKDAALILDKADFIERELSR